MKQNPHYILFLFLCFTTFLSAQHTESSSAQAKPQDSLAKYSYEELEKKFYDTRFSDKESCKIYAEKYLSKAKLDNDKVKISRGYFHMAIFYYTVSNKDLRSIQYTDSIIEICKDCNDKDFPALGYYMKGVYLYDLGDNKKALNVILLTLDILKKNTNIRLEMDARNVIISLKANWASNEEVLRYYSEFLDFIKKQKNYRKEFEVEYAIILANLANAYARNKNYNKQLELAKLGIKEKFDKIITPNSLEFVSIAGTAQYYLGNYQAAIDSTLKALPHLIKINDRNVIMKHFYLAKSYDKLKQPEKAQFHFLKTDSIYQATKDIFPEMRIAYEHIIDYYKSKNDVENQIKYYDRLIETDKIIDSTYTYVTETIQKKYETPQIIAERAALLEKVQNDKNSWKYSFGIISVVLLIILGVLVYVFRRQKYYKKRFEQLMNSSPEVLEKQPGKVRPEALEGQKNDLEVPESTIENILKGLSKFEDSEGFTKQTTLGTLAKKLKTNPKYLSKVINKQYEKNFSSYLNELRVQYIITKLKSDSKFRNYTIKAIAEEAGFGNTESFSKAFYKNTGISPSYFIKELHKRQNH